MKQTIEKKRVFEEAQSRVPSKARFDTEQGFDVGADSGNVADVKFRRESTGGFNMKQEQALERVDKALSDLEKALAKGESETLKKYLQFLGGCHHYSFGNLMLIFSQLPEASHVAGFRKWITLGRHVRKGEKGIRILAPLVRKSKDEDRSSGDPEKKTIFGFKMVAVFDVSQTDGDDLPTLGSYQGEPVEQLESLEIFTAAKEIELIWEAPGGGALGVSKGGTILVDPSLDLASRFAVLVHEVAHELLHRTDRRKETTTALRETEAEAVAYAVCSAVGLETNDHAADYIHLHQGDVEKLKSSLDMIRNAASEILSALSVSESSGDETEAVA